MPAPDKNMLSQYVKMNFISHNITLPVRWKDMGPHFNEAFEKNELSIPPNSPVCLFKSATLHKQHVETAKQAGDIFEKFIDKMAEAICDGIKKWMKTTQVVGAIINGPVISMTPGTLFSPPILMGIILSKAPKSTPQELKFSRAIANAFNTAWTTWQNGFMLNLPLYPSFSAMPAGVAPPTMNMPTPIISGSSSGEIMLSPSNLKNLMVSNLGDPQALHSNELFDSFAKAINTTFTQFKLTTMIQNVSGTGPVPAYPTGPVVAGTTIPAPGVLK